MDNHFDVIIVGGGIVGAALLCALAERGRRGLWLTDSARSASGREPELLSAWDEDWRVARFAAESLRVYRTLPCRFQTADAMHLVRGIELPVLREQVGFLNAHGASLCIVPFDELRQKYPGKRLAAGDLGVVEDAAGTACRFEAGISWVTRAQDAGSVTRVEEGACEVVRRDGCVAGVVTGASAYHASRVVFIDDKLGKGGRLEFSAATAGLLQITGWGDVHFRIAPALAQRAASLLCGKD